MTVSAYNGKAAELNKRVFELLESVCQPLKENGTTLVSQGGVSFYQTSIVIRQVERPWSGAISDEEIKVQLEQTYLHYAIVPQVAYYRNKQTVSFVSPYFRGGNLEKTIQRERDKISDKPTEKPLTLNLREKIRILYQICCAIDYLHQPPECDRKAVTHGYINMKNVLLDKQKNARVLFFKPRSVKGEKSFADDEKKDVHDLIDVICKVLEEPPGEKTEYISTLLESVSKQDVTLAAILKIFKSLVRTKGIKRWTRLPDDAKNKMCEICCVNKPELLHCSNCSDRIQMCVGCMRNWQYNPVKCHSCDRERIQSPVGDGWGAILIAGTDKDPVVTKRFEKDVDDMKDKLIKEVTIMGVREKDVIPVKTSTATYQEQLDKAFTQIDTADINTVVLVYSGHHGDGGFQIDPGKEEYIEDDEFVRKVNNLKHVQKIVLYLDCCFPKKLNIKDKVVVQCNAVKGSETASCGPRGSQFINEIVNAMTNHCKDECCNSTQILSFFDLQRHLSRKLDRKDSTKPSYQTDISGEIDNFLAFRPVSSEWLKTLEKSLESSPIPVLKTRLIKFILDKYSTIPLNPIVHHKHSKLVDFYEPTKMSITIEETEHKDGKTCNPDDVGKTDERYLSKIDELLTPSHPPTKQKVYISGEAGMGKTTFSQYLALAWCAVHGESEECVRMREKMKKHKHFHDIESLKQKQLLFLLHLREFEEVSDCMIMLSKFLESDLKYSVEDIDGLMTYINWPKTVLLMDGLDEWTCKEHAMTKFTSVSNARIICTSRPWKIDSCVIEPLKDYIKVVITGIEFDAVKSLVDKVTNCFRQEKIRVHDNTADFIQTLHNKDLRTVIFLNASASKELFMIPMLIVLLLCLWHNGKDFGKTRAQIYINMAETLLHRMKKTPGMQNEETTCNYHLPVLFNTIEATCCIEQRKNIAKLSKLAFYLLFTGQTEHSFHFSEKDLSRLKLSGRQTQEIEGVFNDIKQFGLNSGNIRGTAIPSSSSLDKKYSFIHKSYQEFFAALHILEQNCDINKCQEIVANTKTPQDVVDLANVFDFVCDLDSTRVEAMVSLIVELTAKHAMQTNDETRIKFITTMQDIIFDICSKYVKAGKVSVNLSNLILNGSDLKNDSLSGELMNVLRTNENTIETKNCTINLNNKLAVLCLSQLTLSSNMDVSQFDTEELILVEVLTGCVNLSKVQRLKRIALSLKEPTTVSIPFEDAKRLTFLEMKNCVLSGPLDLSQCPLEQLKLNMTKVKTESFCITRSVEKCEVLNMCCPFDFTDAKNLTELNMMSCSHLGPLDLSQCTLNELKLIKVETEKVVTGYVETCTVRHMDCSFEFTNASNLTNLSMRDCFLRNPLDLTQFKLLELELQTVKTTKVVTGSARTCKVVGMNCLFEFPKESKFTSLSMTECFLHGSLDMSKCQLEELTLYKVETQNVITGCVVIFNVIQMDCSFEFTNAKNLNTLSMQMCSIHGPLNLSQCPLEELTMQTCSMSCQLDLSQCPLKKLSIQNCLLSGQLDLSNCPIEVLEFHKETTENVVSGSLETRIPQQFDFSFEFTKAITLSYLSLMCCSLSGPLDLSQCSLQELKLNKVRTKKVVTGCMVTCTIENMDCPFELTKATNLTNLSMMTCSLPGPLDLSQCPLKKLKLYSVQQNMVVTRDGETCALEHPDLSFEYTNATKLPGSLDLSLCPLEELQLNNVQTKKVITGYVKKYTVKHMKCSFELKNTVKHMNMMDCSLPDPLDLSQCQLVELKLQTVKTEKVVLGHVETCTVEHMDCSFEFTNAVNLTNLSMMDCSLQDPLDLSQCSLEKLKLHNVSTKNLVTGNLRTCEVVQMDCPFKFRTTLTNLSMKGCSLPDPLDLSQCQLVELKLQKVKTEKVVIGHVETCAVEHMDCLFEFTNAVNLTSLSMMDCSLPGQLDMSQCQLKELKLHNIYVKTCEEVRMDCLFKFPSTLTNLSMKECILPDPLDLSQCQLVELKLQTVKTEKVVLGHVETCAVEHMDCLFEFTNAVNLTNLSMMDCSPLQGPLDLSQCQLVELKLQTVKTEKVIIGHVMTCTVEHMDCLFEFRNAVNLTNLSMMDCSLPASLDLSHCQLKKLNMQKCSLSGQLNISRCPLEELKLHNVTTENVFAGCLEKLVLDKVNSMNVNKHTYFSMIDCSFSGRLDLSQCQLKTLNMQNCSLSDYLDLSQCPINVLKLNTVTTKKVIIGCVDFCFLENMSCSFQFKNKTTLINLSFINCDLTQQLSLSNCPLQSLKLVEVANSHMIVGSLEKLTRLCISDCKFLSEKLLSALTTLEIKETRCNLSSIELSRTSIGHLILHKPKISKSVFEKQMEHLYGLPRQVTCTVRGSSKFLENTELKKAIDEIMKASERFSVKQNPRYVTICTRK
ncbi:uncharacterized protein LOC128223940 isoform X2 [Mya arenaria]|uniref:uncharacterized protein LOC128223940 isoform X2 n=1 Tax=Mya arenaria TaxID=6604 RepID=UPI0022E5DE52|nr:uncharacterized protein LOC128223940 isoform X2 [Mya arenaria]